MKIKITESQLRQVIKEEIEAEIQEMIDEALSDWTQWAGSGKFKGGKFSGLGSSAYKMRKAIASGEFEPGEEDEEEKKAPPVMRTPFAKRGPKQIGADPALPQIGADPDPARLQLPGPEARKQIGSNAPPILKRDAEKVIDLFGREIDRKAPGIKNPRAKKQILNSFKQAATGTAKDNRLLNPAQVKNVKKFVSHMQTSLTRHGVADIDLFLSFLDKPGNKMTKTYGKAWKGLWKDILKAGVVGQARSPMAPNPGPANPRTIDVQAIAELKHIVYQELIREAIREAIFKNIKENKK